MSTSQVEAVWKRMQAGGAVPELGWGGADPTARARLLAWPTWDLDQILNDH